jgi:hypothetical protein
MTVPSRVPSFWRKKNRIQSGRDPFQPRLNAWFTLDRVQVERYKVLNWFSLHHSLQVISPGKTIRSLAIIRFPRM